MVFRRGSVKRVMNSPNMARVQPDFGKRYAQAERGFGLTMSRSAIAIGYGSLGGLVDEFYPDISHWLFHRHQKQAAD